MSMTSTFQCEYCQCFTFKRCDKFKLKCIRHGGMASGMASEKLYRNTLKASTFQAVRVISIKILLVISMLYKTYW